MGSWRNWRRSCNASWTSHPVSWSPAYCFSDQCRSTPPFLADFVHHHGLGTGFYAYRYFPPFSICAHQIEVRAKYEYVIRSVWTGHLTIFYQNLHCLFESINKFDIILFAINVVVHDHGTSLQQIHANISTSLLEGLRVNSQPSEHLALANKELWGQPLIFGRRWGQNRRPSADGLSSGYRLSHWRRWQRG